MGSVDSDEESFGEYNLIETIVDHHLGDEEACEGPAFGDYVDAVGDEILMEHDELHPVENSFFCEEADKGASIESSSRVHGLDAPHLDRDDCPNHRLKVKSKASRPSSSSSSENTLPFIAMAKGFPSSSSDDDRSGSPISECFKYDGKSKPEKKRHHSRRHRNRHDDRSMSKVAAVRRVRMGHGTVEYGLMLPRDSVLPIILGITQFIIILLLLATRS